MAAALAPLLPRYDPSAAASRADSRVNPGVVRMPAFVVHNPRMREFTERELYTPAGLKELAMKRYISEFDSALNAFHLPLFSGYSTAEDRGNTPEKRAMAQFDEEETRERRARMAELWALDRMH